MCQVIFQKKKALANAFFVVLVLLGLLAIPVQAVAERNSRQGTGSGKNGNIVSLFHSDVVNGPESGFTATTGWRVTLRKSIFNNYEKASRFTSSSHHNLRSNPYGYDDLPLVSTNDENRIQSLAREEAYRVFSNLVGSFKPVAILKEELKPFTKPIELYKGNDGTVIPSYFGHNAAKSAGAVKMFTLNMGVSAGNNLNIVLDFYDNISLAFFDGNKLEITYIAPGGGYRIGLQENGFDKIMLVGGMVF